ncbi:hypothetical protein TRIUR3_24565 [Triticum urartu]|uniref:Uncharacterized protein n=1 Tax=Triticum urartu TaxID=4572 RepID=M8A621_TRIUA|nr:hypothetical protein TRIUR3_24565 [Triticum urartu]
MEIQQHDGVVVEVAGSRQGFAKLSERERCHGREREVPGAQLGPSYLRSADFDTDTLCDVLTPAEANTTRTSSTNLAAAEAAAPKIDLPKTELVIRPPQLDYYMLNHHTVHFLPTASESKVVLVDRGNRMLRFDVVDGTRCIDTLPWLHGPKVMPMSISVPPTDVHLYDGEHTGDLYIIDGLLYPHMAEERPQFEALVWRGIRPTHHSFWHCDILPLPPWITHHKRAFVHGHALVGDTICFSISGTEDASTSNSAGIEGAGTYCFHIATREWSKAGDWLMPFHGKADYVPELGLWGIRPTHHSFWHCDILPLPPWITHHKRAFVHGHALVGDTICFSISGTEDASTSNSAGIEGAGTYCFHIATREWSKAGDWLMPFHGKADYVPELGLWFGISSQGNLPCAADLSGVVTGEEPSPDKMRIWARDDLPEEWQPDILFRSKVASLGSGRFILMDMLDTIAPASGKEFTLFTGMELAFSNGSKGNESGHHNSRGNESSSSGDENGAKGKGTMCGLRMIKHKSGRYMLKRKLEIKAVF